MVNKEKKVSKEKFDAYVVVQKSGVTNMFAVNEVIEYAYQFCGVDLTKTDCFYIMNNYSELEKEYK